MSDESAPAPYVRTEPIRPGEVAPSFELPAVLDGGEQIEVAIPCDAVDGPILLIFYQDDGMPICTSQLKAFAQEFDLLQDAGVQVFGVNTNGLGSHAKFHERDHFPVPLISDFHAEAVKAYGLWDSDEGKARRAVVIIGKDGKVQYVQPHFNPGNVNAIVEVFTALGLV